MKIDSLISSADKKKSSRNNHFKKSSGYNNSFKKREVSKKRKRQNLETSTSNSRIRTSPNVSSPRIPDNKIVWHHKQSKRDLQVGCTGGEAKKKWLDRKMEPTGHGYKHSSGLPRQPNLYIQRPVAPFNYKPSGVRRGHIGRYPGPSGGGAGYGLSC